MSSNFILYQNNFCYKNVREAFEIKVSLCHHGRMDCNQKIKNAFIPLRQSVSQSDGGG